MQSTSQQSTSSSSTSSSSSSSSSHRHPYNHTQQQQYQQSQNWFLNKVQAFHQAHNRLKHTVHTAWRYPLPPWGRFLMGCVYFSIPVVAGYAISTWAVSISEATVQERFANTDNKDIQGIGDKRIVQDENGQVTYNKVGAGGWGGGVHLVTSDHETHDINRINLERFLKKQRRLKLQKVRQEQQEATTAAANDQ